MHVPTAPRPHPYYLVLALFLAAPACDSNTSPTDPPSAPVPAVITVFPEQATLTSFGPGGMLQAQVLDQNGLPMTGVPVSWTSNDPTVASVTASGAITALSNGTTTVNAMAGEVLGTTTITVNVETPTQPGITTVAQILAGGVFGEVVLVGVTTRMSGNDADEWWFTDDGGANEIVLDFQSNNVAPTNTTIIVVGNVSASEVDVSSWGPVSP